MVHSQSQLTVGTQTITDILESNTSAQSPRSFWSRELEPDLSFGSRYEINGYFLQLFHSPCFASKRSSSVKLYLSGLLLKYVAPLKGPVFRDLNHVLF